MKFPHPYRRIKTAYSDLRGLLVRTIFSLTHLAAVVQENTTLNAELLQAARATQVAAQRLVNIELHRQNAAGQRTDF